MGKFTVELDITNCRDCVFKKNEYGHGYNLDMCTHPELGPASYDHVIGDVVPKWCPLGLGAITKENTNEN
jgi:hypothetical protein